VRPAATFGLTIDAAGPNFSIEPLALAAEPVT
jgi:hypothetical protein